MKTKKTNSKFSHLGRTQLIVLIGTVALISFFAGYLYARPTAAYNSNTVALALTATERARPTNTRTLPPPTSTTTATSTPTSTATSTLTGTATSTPFPEAVQTLLSSISTATANSISATETRQQLSVDATATRAQFEFAATATEAAKPKPTENLLTRSRGSGIYAVGIDIAPGRWEVTDPSYINTQLSSQPNCYWAIYNIVGNVNRDNYGQVPPFVIQVHPYPPDALVEFDGCGVVKYLGP